LEGLKEATAREVGAIPPEMTRRVMEKNNEGRHLSDEAFKFSNCCSRLVWFLLASQIGQFLLP
jgi:hypothetical protein